MTNKPKRLMGIHLEDARDYIKERYKIDVSLTRLRGWIVNGLISPNRQRIYLRAEKHVGWLTTCQWINTFFELQLQELGGKQSVSKTETKDTEELFNLAGAQRYIRKQYYRNITLPTLRNWILRGRTSRSGRRYILCAKKRGGLWRGWFTCEKWIDAFVCELDT